MARIEAQDQDMGHWVHWSLLAGLVVSGCLLTVGLGLRLASGPRPQEGPPSPVPSLVREALQGDGVALINLGLLTLIGTPMLRVVVLGIGWAREGDYRFAAVALIVLALLGLGLVLGLG